MLRSFVDKSDCLLQKAFYSVFVTSSDNRFWLVGAPGSITVSLRFGRTLHYTIAILDLFRKFDAQQENEQPMEHWNSIC